MAEIPMHDWFEEELPLRLYNHQDHIWDDIEKPLHELSPSEAIQYVSIDTIGVTHNLFHAYIGLGKPPYIAMLHVMHAFVGSEFNEGKFVEDYNNANQP